MNDLIDFNIYQLFPLNKGEVLDFKVDNVIKHIEKKYNETVKGWLKAKKFGMKSCETQ